MQIASIKLKRVLFSNINASLEDVEEYYVDSDESLKAYFVPGHEPGVALARFIGYTKTELDDELKMRKETLDRMCSLEILSAIEARFRIDYLLRCQDKMKDGLSRQFREIPKQKENRASLANDIIPTWRAAYPEHKARLDNLGKALDFRHWLAHGRYWQPIRTPHVRRYDYLSIYTLALDILSNMDLKQCA